MTTIRFKWRKAILGVLFCAVMVMGQGAEVFGEEDGGAVFFKPNSVASDPYENYPEEFSGRGVLDVLTSATAVISDSEFALDSSASFHEPGRQHALPSSFEKGQAVAFIVNDQGQIVSMWKLNQMDDLMLK